MIRIAALALVLLNAGATSPVGGGESSGAGKKNRVVDLGQLEIEGELRRPPVNWVGNYKGMREIIPILYAAEFERLEKEIVSSEGGDAALRAVKMTLLPADLQPQVAKSTPVKALEKNNSSKRKKQ